MGLKERQLKAIKYVKENGKITNKEYQKVTEVSEATATRDFQELTNKYPHSRAVGHSQMQG